MWTILFAVEVPLVTKNVRWAPKQRAARSCASLIVPVGLQQRVEPAGGGARLGHEQVVAVEPAEVADPARVEHRVPARDGQRVEVADRPLGVLPQGVEERRLHPSPHAVEQGHVQLVRRLEAVEDAREQLGGPLAGRGQRLVRQQVEVQLGPQVAERPRQASQIGVGGRLERRQHPVQRGAHAGAVIGRSARSGNCSA